MEKQVKKDSKSKAQKIVNGENYEERAFFLLYSLLLYGPGFIELEGEENKKLTGKILANG